MEREAMERGTGLPSSLADSSHSKLRDGETVVSPRFEDTDP